METIIGKLNQTFLLNTLTRSYPASTHIQAAVAYADFFRPFIDHIQSHRDVKLTFYGRMDHQEAVSLQLLDWFLTKAPSTAECRLINGRYHPKVIWWHGYGAYIGSANLTENGWVRNLEVGLFLPEEELEESGVDEQLDLLFDELERISIELSPEVYTKLVAVSQERKRAQVQLDRVKAKYDELLGKEKPYAGQVTSVVKRERGTRARERFVEEWRGTLQLLRRVCREFHGLGKRPRWVPGDVNPTVHFDQFLHAYYYNVVLKSADEGLSMDKVLRLHRENSGNPAQALAQASEWWAGLPEAPTEHKFNEESFIKERAPRMQELLSEQAFATMTEDRFVEALCNVHALREHARQIGKRHYELPSNHHESVDERVERFSRWLWTQSSEEGKSAMELLQFVVYGKHPAEVEDRLWLATKGKTWKIPHLGKSALGEILGWARPNDYPPRNDRTNKALLALGYPVKVFSPGAGQQDAGLAGAGSV